MNTTYKHVLLRVVAVAGLISCSRQAHEPQRRIEDFMETPEVQAAMKTDYSDFCSGRFFRSKPVDPKACVERVRGGQLITAACVHILRSEGLAVTNTSVEAQKRFEACLRSFGAVLDGGLGPANPPMPPR